MQHRYEGNIIYHYAKLVSGSFLGSKVSVTIPAYYFPKFYEMTHIHKEVQVMFFLKKTLQENSGYAQRAPQWTFLSTK